MDVDGMGAHSIAAVRIEDVDELGSQQGRVVVDQSQKPQLPVVVTVALEGCVMARGTRACLVRMGPMEPEASRIPRTVRSSI